MRGWANGTAMLAALAALAAAGPVAARNSGNSIPRDRVPTERSRAGPTHAPMTRTEASRALSIDTPLAIGTTARQSAAVSDKLRLRVETMAVGPVGSIAAGTMPAAASALRDRVHRRLAGSMIEYYPVDGTGFHLSAGTHLYAPRSDGEDRQGMFADHVPSAASRADRRPGLRSTPAATIGYTGRLDGATAIGVEMGALKGRNYPTAREMGEPGGARDKTINPMVNLTIGRRF